MNIKNNPIGFFDSGVGGLSVMREAISIMPNENFIYFGDSKNAPYGTRTPEEVTELSFNAVEFLMQKNVKAIVIACNTATSAAAQQIREKYRQMPIIGIEPAIKPAVNSIKKGKVIVMATPMTLREKKFNMLLKSLNTDDRIVSLPCAGLVEFVEKGILSGDELKQYLTRKLSLHLNEPVSSIVLGCTHFPFVKEAIKNVVGEDIPLIDGSHGTSMELHRKLEEKNILNDNEHEGNIQIYNSNNNRKVINFCYNLIGRNNI